MTHTSLPYTPYLDYIGRGCGGTKVNGSNGVLDGVTINALHEYAETVNDPGLNAWLDVDNSENADKCSWINLANKTLTNGYVFRSSPPGATPGRPRTATAATTPRSLRLRRSNALMAVGRGTGLRSEPCPSARLSQPS